MPALTAHFTLEELDGTAAPLAVKQNLQRLAALLENVRAILGVPIRVTSGYRPPEQNAAVGGVERSQHLDGTAADIAPVGLSLAEVQDRLEAAERQGRLALYGQLIFYPYTTGHIHLALATRGKVRERLVKLGGEAGGYSRLPTLATFRSGEAGGGRGG